MKISNIPTEYLFIKAMTNSEWDNCSFAVIHITEEWKQCQKKRLKAVTNFENDNDFKWLNYSDTTVDFYKFSYEGKSEIKHWLFENDCFFAEVSFEEIQKLSVPDNNLNCYQMQVFNNGNAIYNAFGKHTGEEFWTDQFSLNELTM
jgi:hypothetical protein